MTTYILALDQGTTSSRAIIFDRRGNVVGISQQSYPQYYPHPGWVEHDPIEIWSTQLQVAKAVLEENNITAEQIAAIGITNQRETTILWDKTTGEPIANAIVWQDKRTADYCETLKNEGFDRTIKAKTGLVTDAYFSATKIKWLLENTPDFDINNCLFGTVDTWLLWKLTGGKVHATDYSNASRTMLYNIHDLCWDEEILNKMNIPAHILPEVYPSSHFFGKVKATIFGAEITIAGIAGDQQAALFGQRCFEKGAAKNTYGTGCFMLMNTGEKAVDSASGLLTTIAWGVNGGITYALEGSVFIAGAAVQWLRDGLELIETAAESETIALGVEDTEEVYVVPAFAGLGAPYWDMYARGAIYGLTGGVTKAHLVRATLESLAYQTCDVLKAMEKDSGISLHTLKVDGGASANNFLMQFQADILNTLVKRPQMLELTAYGAALLAGIQVGFYEFESLCRPTGTSTEFVPQMEEHIRQEKYKGWVKAIKRTMVK